jgi:hypothetical protein
MGAVVGVPYDNRTPVTRYLGETDHRKELIEGGLAELTGTERGGGDGVDLTFDGWLANERIRSGVYKQSKGIYEARALRYAETDAMEELPGWDIF